MSIHVSNGKVTSYDGPDAVNYFRARMIYSSIGLHRKCGMMPTRGVTITKLFAMATTYTGIKYKRGEHAKAEYDLLAWCGNNMPPIVEN